MIEAKQERSTLTGVEVQSARYAQGPPATLPAWVRPLPFGYESTAIATHFTLGLEPEPRARSVFAFHRPDTMAAFLQYLPAAGAAAPTGAIHTGTATPQTVDYMAATLVARLQSMPPLMEAGLWPAQIKAVRNLEASLKANLCADPQIIGPSGAGVSFAQDHGPEGTTDSPPFGGPGAHRSRL